VCCSHWTLIILECALPCYIRIVSLAVSKTPSPDNLFLLNLTVRSKSKFRQDASRFKQRTNWRDNISTANIASPINLLFAAWHLTSPVWIYLKTTSPERWSLLPRDRLFNAQFSIIRVQWLQLPNVEKIEKNFIWPNSSAIWYVLSNMTSKK